MVDMTGLLESIQESFTISRDVDFEKENLHFCLEPVTAEEELKVIEACADAEGARYINSLKNYSLAFAIKKINDIDFHVTEVATMVDGEEKVQTKFLYLSKIIEKWPAPLRDVIFDVFQNLQDELEASIEKSVKFKKFVVPTSDVELEKPSKVPEGFTEVKKPAEDETVEPV